MNTTSAQGFTFTPSRRVAMRPEAQLRWNKDGKLEQLVTIITYHPLGAIDDAYQEWRLVPTETE